MFCDAYGPMYMQCVYGRIHRVGMQVAAHAEGIGPGHGCSGPTSIHLRGQAE